MRLMFLLGALFATSWLLAAAPAHADGEKIALQIDSVGAVGSPIEVVVTVTSPENDTPVSGAKVTLTTLAEFGGERSFIVLARSVTGPEGTAVMRFAPRTAGEQEFRAEVLIPGQDRPLIESSTVTIAGSDGQQYQPEGRIGIFRSELIIISVVFTVWIVLFLIALGIADIARAGEDPEPDNGDEAPV